MASTEVLIQAVDFALACPCCHAHLDAINIHRVYELSGFDCPECWETLSLGITLERA